MWGFVGVGGIGGGNSDVSADGVFVKAWGGEFEITLYARRIYDSTDTRQLDDG